MFLTNKRQIMKKNILLILTTFLLISCSSVKVASDYDTKVDFNKYKTFAFYKTGIDKAEISDLDKKRILRAIENELVAKGFTKSDNPDMLVSMFTKSREKVDINQNYNYGYGFGYGWNPWVYGNMNNVNVSQYTEGSLFIDFIDKEKKELVWQGIGTAALKNQNVSEREERINLIVKEIIDQYPPNSKK